MALLEDRLGEIARLAQDALGVRRLSGQPLPEPELRAWLEARGWPASAAVLEAEQVAGGYMHPRGGAFGLLEAARSLAEGLVPPLHAPPLDRARSDPKTGLRLLPVWLGEDPFLWLAEDGALHFGSHADGLEYFARSFDSVVVYWEILLLLGGHVVSLTPPWTPLEPRVEIGGLVAERLAGALGLAEDGVARGRGTRAFASTEASVVELHAPGFVEGTLVAAAGVEAAALATTEALACCDDVVLLLPQALEDDLLAGLPPARAAREGGTVVYRWGKLGRYRDAGYRRRHRERA